MVYTLLAALFIILALLIVFWSAKLLIKGNWFLGWLRGMVGLFFILCATLLGMMAVDFYSYQQLSKEVSVASISFTELEPQRFQVSLVDDQGSEQRYELTGDLWQLDARIIKWNKSLTGLGLSPGYRLDRLSGRYYSLEKEQSAPKTVHQLGGSNSPLDIWQWLKTSSVKQSLLDASYGSATYLPMEDGALYAVSLSNTGLLARPLNDRAKTAVDRWE